MNTKIKNIAHGFGHFIGVSVLLYIVVWLPLFILGEMKIISDDLGSVVGIAVLPCIIAVVLAVYVKYQYARKDRYYLFGLFLPGIVTAVFVVISLLAIGVAGEM